MKDEEHYWLKGFAIEKGFPAQNLSEWARANKKFSEALKMAKDRQEYRLVGLGLSRDHNSAMPIFALKNCAGWRNVVGIEGNAALGIEEIRVVIVSGGRRDAQDKDEEGKQ